MFAVINCSGFESNPDSYSGPAALRLELAPDCFLLDLRECGLL